MQGHDRLGFKNEQIPGGIYNFRENLFNTLKPLSPQIIDPEYVNLSEDELSKSIDRISTFSSTPQTTEDSFWIRKLLKDRKTCSDIGFALLNSDKPQDSKTFLWLIENLDRILEIENPYKMDKVQENTVKLLTKIFLLLGEDNQNMVGLFETGGGNEIEGDISNYYDYLFQKYVSRADLLEMAEEGLIIYRETGKEKLLQECIFQLGLGWYSQLKGEESERLTKLIDEALKMQKNDKLIYSCLSVLNSIELDENSISTIVELFNNNIPDTLLSDYEDFINSLYANDKETFKFLRSMIKNPQFADQFKGLDDAN